MDSLQRFKQNHKSEIRHIKRQRRAKRIMRQFGYTNKQLANLQ